MPCCLLGVILSVVSFFSGSSHDMVAQMRAHPTSAPKILVCEVHAAANHVR